MSAHIGTIRSSGTLEESGIRGIDRWIYPGMALLFLVTALVGFIPTSILFLTFMIWVMGKRNLLLLAVTPSLITLAVWLVFEKVLALSMPPGILVDYL